MTDDFNASYLWSRTRSSRIAIKIWLMDQKYVVGVGNIYAQEALFAAGIHPKLPARQLTLAQSKDCIQAIKSVLKSALSQGGTTLKDYRTALGSEGLFQVKLKVYGRAGKPCLRCGNLLLTERLGGRATVFCSHCTPYADIIEQR